MLVLTLEIIEDDVLPFGGFLPRAIAFFCAVSILLFASASSAQSNPQASGAAQNSVPPSVTLRVSTRMVTVDVVVRDRDGHPVPGLAASDFQVFEQPPGFHKEKREQKIAAFRAVSVAEIAAQDKGSITLPAGVYSNYVTMQKAPVPPTIVLVDGLNTDLVDQVQVHQQAVKMLASLPANVPVAVFLLGRQLRMLQGFTTDPTLLRAALQKPPSSAGTGIAQVDPRDDPESLSAFMEAAPHVSADSINVIERFEQETYAFTMDMRVKETIEALRSIARHVAGYPGRKNLLWISSSFPIVINEDGENHFEAMRNYHGQIEELANAMGEAKIAVYPMDPAGLQTESYFQAATEPRENQTSGAAAARALNREAQFRVDQRTTMEVLAKQTGGQVCVQDNDLSDCVRKAMEDSSSFYEIAYYPDSRDWHGEYRKIGVKTTNPTFHLTYRQGYFARPEVSVDNKSAQATLEEAVCQDFLTATSILIAVKTLPPDAPNQVKYFLSVDPTMISFPLGDDGTRDLKLKIALCTFDKSGKALKFMLEPMDRKVTEKQYLSIQSQGRLPHQVALTAGSDTAAVRLLVEDVPSGRLGSVNLPYAATVAALPPAAGSASAAPSTPH